MMRYALALLVLGCTAAMAQSSRPQLTWSGYITGSATLYIQQGHADIQGRDTGAVDRPRVKFFAPLPAAKIRVTVNVRRGTGDVDVVEQPVPDNEYSAVVQITAKQRPEYYTLDFYWDDPANPSKDRARSSRGRAPKQSPPQGDKTAPVSPSGSSTPRP